MIYIVVAYIAFTAGFWTAPGPLERGACVEEMIELYGDICAEESTGYEDMSPEDAHFAGVKCAAEYMRRWCD